MNLREPNLAIPQLDSGGALHLPPVAFAIQAPESCEVTDSASGRDRFGVCQAPEQLDIHCQRL